MAFGEQLAMSPVPENTTVGGVGAGSGVSDEFGDGEAGFDGPPFPPQAIHRATTETDAASVRRA
jgi:hypothetical protein